MTVTIQSAGITADFGKALSTAQATKVPLVINSVIENSVKNKIVITFDSPMFIGATFGLSASNNTILSATYLNNVVKLLLSRDAVAGEIATWTFNNVVAGATLRNADTGYLVPSGTYVIKNNVGIIPNMFSNAYSDAYAGGIPSTPIVPVVVSLVVEDATPTIIRMTTDLTVLGTEAGLSVSNNTVISIANNGLMTEITVTTPIINAEVVDLTYVPGDLTTPQGGILAGFGPSSVTNNVGITNQPPVANDDAVSIYEGGQVVIDVLANDTDDNNAIDPTTVVITSAPAKGNAFISPTTGIITYTHTASDSVDDTLQYTVDDTLGATSNAATVSITINAITPHLSIASDGTVTGNGTLVNDSTTVNTINQSGVITATSVGEIAKNPNLQHRGDAAQILHFSNDLTNVIWPDRKILRDTVGGNAGPDGGTNAIHLIPSDTFSAIHNIKQLFTPTVGDIYYFSVFVKAGVYDGVVLGIDGLGDGLNTAQFNLLTGALGIKTAAILDYGIEAYAAGWFRCWIKHQWTGGDNEVNINVGPVTEFDGLGKFNAYTGDRIKGVYVDCAQLEKDNLSNFIYSLGAQQLVMGDIYNLTTTNNIFSDVGIVLFRFTPNIESIDADGLVSVDGSTSLSLLFRDINNVFHSFDGTSDINLIDIYAPGDDILCALCYTGAARTLMTSINAAAFIKTQGAYSGAFPIGALINIGLDSSAFEFQALQIYHDGFEFKTMIELETWVETNAHANT